ncbi:MAG TPA: ribbon-helix-helix domain-containing protein [Magnetospirillaceae bacterium]
MGSVAKSESSSISRNVTIQGHRTSLRLQKEMWDAIDEICRRERLSIHQLCSRIAERRNGRSLTSEVRVYAVDYFRAACNDEGHLRAGHGQLADAARQVGLHAT